MENFSHQSKIHNLKDDFCSSPHIQTSLTKTADDKTNNPNSVSNKIQISEYQSFYKSCDFNPKDFDEKLESPIDTRNLESNSGSFFNSASPDSSTNASTKFEIPSRDIKNTIHLKNNSITNLNYFVQSYVNDIYILYNKIDAIVYKKVTSILDKNKYFLRFFKEITTLYETFSLNLLQANNTISLHFKQEDENSPYSKINTTIEKSQETVSNSFYDFSKNLQNKLIIKGPLSNVKEFYNRMSQISKESAQIISEITQKRDKINSKYVNFEKSFENFKKNFNDPEKLSSLLLKTEFFMIEFEFCNSVNKLFSIIKDFFIKYKKCLQDLKDLTTNFLNILKESVDVYVNESNRMFLIEVTENLLENLKLNIEDESGEKDILFSSESKLLKDILKKFQTNLLKFTFVRNEKIYCDEYFQIETYKSYEELTDFLISIIPENVNTLNSSLIMFSCEVNKIYGLFSSCRKCFLIITIQNSLILFEEKINKKSYEKYNIKNLKFRNLEDSKHPLRFEISEIKQGFIYNTTQRVTIDVSNSELYKELENILTFN
jgi:hypothetical protein